MNIYYVCGKIIKCVGLLSKDAKFYCVCGVNIVCLTGQGFAFKRKEKVKHEYNKILRKERKKTPESKMLYKEVYPEHLKHLYMAEAEKLKNDAWTNRMNRSKLRIKRQTKLPDMDDAALQTDLHPEGAGDSEQTDSGSGNPEQTEMSEKVGEDLR